MLGNTILSDGRGCVVQAYGFRLPVPPLTAAHLVDEGDKLELWVRWPDGTRTIYKAKP